MTFNHAQAAEQVAFIKKTLDDILDFLLDIDLTPKEWDMMESYLDEAEEDVLQTADVLEELRDAKENAEGSDE